MASDTDDDDETPWEDRPGYLGVSWDRQLNLEPPVAQLAHFDWTTYAELLQSLPHGREVHVDLPDGRVTLSLNGYEDAAQLLLGLPSVVVCDDHGPPDAGPAAGSGYVIMMADGSTEDRVRREVEILVAALDADLVKLEIEVE